MKKALMLTWTGFQDHEVVYPYYRLLADKFSVDLVADKRDELGRVYGIFGLNMPCTLLLSEFYSKLDENLSNYDFLVLPGGVKSLEKLRQEKKILDFIHAWNNKEKIIASTCHGAQLLISSKIVKGRKIAGYYSLEDDLSNAGAIYSKDPVVVDKNIISSPHYDFMGEWMEEALLRYKSWAQEL
jgi:protease I